MTTIHTFKHRLKMVSDVPEGLSDTFKEFISEHHDFYDNIIAVSGNYQRACFNKLKNPEIVQRYSSRMQRLFTQFKESYLQGASTLKRANLNECLKTLVNVICPDAEMTDSEIADSEIAGMVALPVLGASSYINNVCKNAPSSLKEALLKILK